MTQSIEEYFSASRGSGRCGWILDRAIVGDVFDPPDPFSIPPHCVLCLGRATYTHPCDISLPDRVGQGATAAGNPRYGEGRRPWKSFLWLHVGGCLTCLTSDWRPLIPLQVPGSMDFPALPFLIREGLAGRAALLQLSQAWEE